MVLKLFNWRYICSFVFAVIFIFTLDNFIFIWLNTDRISAPSDESIVKVTKLQRSTILSPETEKEKRHVVYVRIPKTGSSTISSLLWQFAWRRNLSVLTTDPRFTGTIESLSRPAFFLPPEGKTCDIMAEHVLYDIKSYSPFFHPETIYITMLREPMSMLISSLYYIPEFRKGVPGLNKLESYLKDPGKYDNIAIKAHRSFTRNPQSGYLGLTKIDMTNEIAVNTLISFIGADFTLVMILERLDESLILLKRNLDWTILDILTAESNFNQNPSKPTVRVTSEQTEKYQKWSSVDYLLYNHFYKKLNETIENLGDEFQDEVKLFRFIKTRTAQFCRFDVIKGGHLEFQGTKFYKAFKITANDCLLYRTEPLVLIAMIRKRQGLYPYLHHSLHRHFPNISQNEIVQPPIIESKVKFVDERQSK